MMCPLLTICAAILSADGPGVCQGDRCAWFYGDRCAILELAMNTGDIQGISDAIEINGGIS